MLGPKLGVQSGVAHAWRRAGGPRALASPGTGSGSRGGAGAPFSGLSGALFRTPGPPQQLHALLSVTLAQGPCFASLRSIEAEGLQKSNFCRCCGVPSPLWARWGLTRGPLETPAARGPRPGANTPLWWCFRGRQRRWGSPGAACRCWCFLQALFHMPRWGVCAGTPPPPNRQACGWNGRVCGLKLPFLVGSVYELLHCSCKRCGE